MAPEELRAERAPSFDAIEAEGHNYRRYWLPVRDGNGSVIVALTYVVIKPRSRIRTSAEYVGHIIKGLRDHGVPDDYVEWVKKMAVRNNPKLKGKLTWSAGSTVLRVRCRTSPELPPFHRRPFVVIGVAACLGKGLNTASTH